jgi:hypothetical protein
VKRCFSQFAPPAEDPENEHEGEGWPADITQYRNVMGPTIGPMLANGGSLYSGEGQKPSDVNLFLTYRTPTQARNHPAPGTLEYTVIVFYGPTTNAGTFSATLNGADAVNRFHAAPGTAEAVKIPLVSGTNKLQLSIEGATQSGRLATDTDTLTFIIP